MQLIGQLALNPFLIHSVLSWVCSPEALRWIWKCPSDHHPTSTHIAMTQRGSSVLCEGATTAWSEIQTAFPSVLEQSDPPPQPQSHRTNGNMQSYPKRWSTCGAITIPIQSLPLRDSGIVHFLWLLTTGCRRRTARPGMRNKRFGEF